MPDPTVMEVQLSIKGRPLRTYVLSKGTLIAGRDPESGIFLDNVGVSRHHAKFELTPEGYFVEDLASANGTFVNDQPTKRARLKNRDVVRIGKFSLWISIVPDRREKRARAQGQTTAAAFEGTTVLKTDEIAHILTSTKKSENESPFLEVVQGPPEQAKDRDASPKPHTRGTLVLMTVVFVVGVLTGSVAIWLLLR